MVWAFLGKSGFLRVAFFGVAKIFLFRKPGPNLGVFRAPRAPGRLLVHIGSELFSAKLIFLGLPFVGCPSWLFGKMFRGVRRGVPGVGPLEIFSDHLVYLRG